MLASAGCTFGNVTKATVYIVDFADFPKLNAIYAEAMGDHRPARSTVQVAALPKGALLEIDRWRSCSPSPPAPLHAGRGVKSERPPPFTPFSCLRL